MIKALRDRIQSSEFCCSATRRDKPFCWGRHNLPAPFSEPRRKPYALKKWQHENKHRFDQPMHKHLSVRSILSTLSYFAFLHFAFN